MMAASLFAKKKQRAVFLLKKTINSDCGLNSLLSSDYKNGKQSINRCVLQARTFLNAAVLSVAYYYDVILHTGNRFGAGTDANIFMKLYGERGSTEEIQLPSKKGHLERGMINKYKVSAKDLGNLKKVDIRHDNTGIGPAWFLEKVSVRDHSGSRFIFDCGQWLLKRAGEDNLHVELSLSEQNIDQLSSYKGISMDYAKLTEDEHLDAVEETVHKNLSGVLQGIIQSNNNNVSDYSSDSVSDSGSNGLVDENVSFSSVLMLPSARLLVETFGLIKEKIPKSGPKGHLLKEDVLKYISLKKITRPVDGIDLSNVENVKKESIVPHHTPSVKQKVDKKSDVKPSKRKPRSERFEDIHLTSKEMTTSQQYMLSKSTIPHVYSTYECNIDNVSKIQDELSKEGIDVPTDAFLLKASALALKAVPDMNVNYSDDGRIASKANVDIAVTLISEQSFVKPILKGIDNMRLEEVAKNLQKVQNETEGGQMTSAEEASFSFTNLGSFGVSHFSDIITPPQVCAMSIGEPKVMLSAERNLCKTLTITLSYDGRLINETTASLFMESFQKFVDNPSCYIG